MAVVAEIFDGVRGGNVEFGTLSLNPTTIAASSQDEFTLSLSGAASGDMLMVNPRSLTTGLSVVGARVSASGVAAISLKNHLTSSVDGAAVTYDYMLVKAA